MQINVGYHSRNSTLRFHYPSFLGTVLRLPKRPLCSTTLGSVNHVFSLLATRCANVSEGQRSQHASTNSNFPRWSDTFSVLLASRCTSYSTVKWTCLRRSSMNRQLHVTSEGTTSRCFYLVFILSGGKRLLLFVRQKRGIRITWMPTGAPSSLRLFDTIPFIVLMLLVLAR